MQYLYGWKWNERERHPVNEMTEEQARASWETGPQLGVAAGEELAPGTVPEYSLELSAHGEDVRVIRYTPEGSVEAILDYGTIDGRLFLEEVSEYLYPDDGEFHGMAGNLAVRSYFFKPDGYAELTTRIKEAQADKVEEFTGVDVSDHWLDPLEWGDWDRIGRHHPTATPGS